VGTELGTDRAAGHDDDHDDDRVTLLAVLAELQNADALGRFDDYPDLAALWAAVRVEIDALRRRGRAAGLVDALDLVLHDDSIPQFDSSAEAVTKRIQLEVAALRAKAMSGAAARKDARRNAMMAVVAELQPSDACPRFVEDEEPDLTTVWDAVRAGIAELRRRGSELREGIVQVFGEDMVGSDFATVPSAWAIGRLRDVYEGLRRDTDFAAVTNARRAALLDVLRALQPADADPVFSDDDYPDLASVWAAVVGQITALRIGRALRAPATARRADDLEVVPMRVQLMDGGTRYGTLHAGGPLGTYLRCEDGTVLHAGPMGIAHAEPDTRPALQRDAQMALHEIKRQLGSELDERAARQVLERLLHARAVVEGRADDDVVDDDAPIDAERTALELLPGVIAGDPDAIAAAQIARQRWTPIHT
jgi:hypothetical protein